MVFIYNFFLHFECLPVEEIRVLLESGTVKADKVARKDLRFCLPHTKNHMCVIVQYTLSFEAFTQLPIAQIGYTLAVVITIIRKIYYGMPSWRGDSNFVEWNCQCG